MVQKNRDERKRLDDYIRYRNNDMSYSERHAFEKELQRDPFDEEAAEGFSELRPDEILEEIRRLRSRLSMRTSRRIVPLFYRYAAAVTALVIISSVLLVRDLNRPDMLVSENIEQQPETGDPAIMSRTEKAISEIPEITAPETKISMDSIIIADRISIEEEELPEDDVAIVEPEIPRLAIVSEDAGSAQKAARAAGRELAGEIAQPVISGVAIAMEKTDTIVRYIRGRVISSEDGLPLPGAAIVVKGKNRGAVTDAEGYFRIESDSNDMLVANFVGMKGREIQAKRVAKEDISLDADMMALDEVVVVAYAAEKKADHTGAVTIIEPEKYAAGSYIQAEPAGGYNDFRTYIRDNQLFPEDYSGTGREVVRISFRVNINGYLYDFEIIRTPSEAFSVEAIRLLKEGAAWNPSTREGEPFDDSISLRILFRR